MTMFKNDSIIDNFRGEYEFLSNFYRSPFKYNGKLYITVEHAFQAAKATNALDHENIRIAERPSDAKKLGKSIKIREDWELVKQEIMKKCLRQKFKNKNLADKLLKTGDRKLIEGNTWGDQEWGTCKGKGKNLLGKLLMEIRRELKESKDV